MLKTILSDRRVHQETAETLLACLHGEAEGQQLEFKQEIPTTPSGRQKRAQAICALANADGGVVVFGVVETDERASGYKAVSFGDEFSRFQSSIDNLIKPRIVDLRWVTVAVRA